MLHNVLLFDIRICKCTVAGFSHVQMVRSVSVVTLVSVIHGGANRRNSVTHQPAVPSYIVRPSAARSQEFNGTGTAQLASGVQ